MRVLVVDDDPISRRIIVRLVESFGYECVSSNDGEQAWRIFQRDRYPIVVTDWKMPHLDGLDLCRRIRTLRHPRYTYIIVLTNHHKRDDLIEGLEAGADDFMPKPIDSAVLQIRLSAAGRILGLEQDLRNANQELFAANRRLRESSRIDPLMGIQNRLAFEERLENSAAKPFLAEGACGVVMCDIDHFKSYNDTYGHMFGDQLLSAVADAIRRALRAGDRAYRFGGDEIVVLLPNQDVMGAALVGERLCSTIQGLEFRNIAPQPLRVSVSFGVAASAPTGPALAWETLIERADRALYAAKKAGRNCVRICWPSDGAEPEFLDVEQLKQRGAAFEQSLGSLTDATKSGHLKGVAK